MSGWINQSQEEWCRIIKTSQQCYLLWCRVHIVFQIQVHLMTYFIHDRCSLFVMLTPMHENTIVLFYTTTQ
jgi:hypothetical protein